MARKVAICSCNVNDFHSPVGVGKLELYNRYAELWSVIENTVAVNYRHFVAQPKPGMNGIITWYSVPFQETPRHIYELSGFDRKKYDAILTATLDHYNTIINALQQENKTEEHEYLEKALKFIDENFIYCFDGKVVLGIWGMKAKGDKNRISGEYTKDLYLVKPRIEIIFNAGNQGTINGHETILKDKDTHIGKDEIPFVIPLGNFEFIGWDEDPEVYLATETKIFTAQYREKETDLPVDPPSPDFYEASFITGDKGVIKGTAVVKVKSGEELPMSGIPVAEAILGYIFKGWLPNPLNIKITDDIEFTAQYEQVPQQASPSGETGKKKPPRREPGRLGYIGIMGLIVILVYLLTIFYRYIYPIPADKNRGKDTLPTTIPTIPTIPTGPNTSTTTPPPIRKNLPPEPRVIISLDTLHIGIGSDKAVNIVTNRLNLLLDGNASIYQFAIDFKNAYPPNEYQIIYYDPQIKSLQIEIPATQRDLVKQELPKKLNKYSVFIWDESLFENFFQMNDPALQNKSRSWHINACQVRNGWDITLGKREIVTAIIDEGFNLNHPELAGKVVKPFNVWNKTNTIIPSAWDHGTRVAGVALARGNNGIGISGIAPNCSFMPVQVADSKGLMTITSVVEGILTAIYSGADVINISLGMSFTKKLVNYSRAAQRNFIQYHFKEEERLWKEVFRIADEHNTAIVIAAGNGNILVGVDPLQRSSQPIIVAAVNKSKRPYSKTRFSNFGERSTVSAPGVNIYTTYGKKSYNYLSGTSAATAIVTGAVALLKSVNRNLSVAEIKNILTSTGLRVSGDVGNMVQLGKALKKAELSEYPQSNFYKVQSNKSVNINKRT
ncbi:hypothetical protein A4H97_16480 [Niastella yeongjuensis]|uniref:Peptidase S8/S53 domain-containing protein n=1 Tax=Niastella yeongjuensis TaxID=354355 RepID=A0A1V9E111_9BACT|nr:S8 family serine peptidase [Niastella yeongjuensis]OQP39817.1 hypothetical protein A4H97_16480 [Niastella yeongjuensis]SEO06472.1 Serine protease, subtilisin family [Niastella yeongjuensis]